MPIVEKKPGVTPHQQRDLALRLALGATRPQLITRLAPNGRRDDGDEQHLEG